MRSRPNRATPRWCAPCRIGWARRPPGHASLKNAEMIGWANYRIHPCPSPLTVGLERFHTPTGRLRAVLIRSQAEPEAACPDLQQWFQTDHARQTIEAGNKEEKSPFKVQHLMSRSPAGIFFRQC